MTSETDLYRACTLCPRECDADRTRERGFCGSPDRPRVARAAVHLWEEPCIAGTDGKGTGAVFFSGCTLRCAFCQNASISHEGFGAEIGVGRLAEIFGELEGKGVHSLDLVTGTQFVPSILEALGIYRPRVPVVWNSGGYEKAETVRLLEGAVQVYLPDLKHYSPRLSSLICGAGDYFRRASEALKEMRRQTGENEYGEDGILRRGMIVRHLVLPGCTSDTREILRFIASELPGVPVSLMRQYTPQPFCPIRGLDRRVTEAEYRRVLDWAGELGLGGFSQEAESADGAFTPLFDLTGVLRDAPKQPGPLA